jgi:hypothetical protein
MLAERSQEDTPTENRPSSTGGESRSKKSGPMRVAPNYQRCATLSGKLYVGRHRPWTTILGSPKYHGIAPKKDVVLFQRPTRTVHEGHEPTRRLLSSQEENILTRNAGPSLGASRP